MILQKMVNTLEAISRASTIRQKKRYIQELIKLNKKEVRRFLIFVYSPYMVYNIKFLKEEEIAVLSKNFTFPITTLSDLLNRIEKLFLIDKLRGKKAKSELLQLYHSCDINGKILLQMILNRELDVGIGVRLINSVSNIIPSAEYMGAVAFKGFDKLFQKLNISSTTESTTVLGMVQTKADGLFAFCNLEEPSFISRRLKPINFLNKAIKKELREIRIFLKREYTMTNLVFHGELTIPGYSRLEANGIFKALTVITEKEKELGIKNSKPYREKFLEVFSISDKDIREKIRYTVWDLTMTSSVSNGGRFEMVRNIIRGIKSQFPKYHLLEIIETTTITLGNIHTIVDKFEEKLENGEEGVIFKLASAPFETGHSTNCIKFKNIFSGELKIIGFEEGKRKNTLGAVIAESSDGKLLSNISGFSDRLKKEIWEDQDKYLGKIIEVEANDITKSDKNDNYSLMHPRFIDFREDKEVADTFEDLIKSRNSYNLIPSLREDLTEALKKNRS